MINVTKTHLPPIEKYKSYLEKIWQSSCVTNRGPLVLELEQKLKNHLKLKHILFVSNGTIALQIAIKALDLKGEIITTPFSYVATTTALLWQNHDPVFVDIDHETFCIDPSKIENAITEKTTAILATHVYGYPCDVERIKQIADKYKLKIIYDAAHAFGTNYKGTSILNHGDISTLSFHATKLFHTIEGGAIIVNGNDELIKKNFLYHAFGHIGDDYFTIGINGKNSEFHAAMGLCNLLELESIFALRKKVSLLYDARLLSSDVKRPAVNDHVEYNYAYYPVIFSKEDLLLKVKKELGENSINTRRYFFPSLNKLSYIKNTNYCPVSEDISRRVLCLPLYPDLENSVVDKISSIINKCIQNNQSDLKQYASI